jgi:hypothetical protein
MELFTMQITDKLCNRIYICHYILINLDIERGCTMSTLHPLGSRPWVRVAPSHRGIDTTIDSESWHGGKDGRRSAEYGVQS